ncbi:MAG TPA: sugar phosphate isomerase/epimerase [Bryobacteraceae bacterium]|nr:sugar phosphate isomerase/epimerase [Bryobacteraceae bacterium]HPT28831.1 sugar phosphate isomerase/epimerase [Bryobacteraceae bacterium]
MMVTRRQLGTLALPALTAARMVAKPNSNFGGVMIGAITYSFRSLPGSAEETLKYCVECGISGVELMNNVAESYAGAPLPVMRPMGAGGPPQARPGGPGGPPAGGPPGGGPGGPGGRFQATPEQIAARKKAAAELSAWRTSASMDKYKEFRKMYEDAGVKIYCFKLPPTLEMPEAEYDYIWNVAETLGANHITMELPTNDELLARVAAYAAKRKLAIAFHTHGQGGASGFDKVLSASKYTALNFDVGHYFGVNGESPVPLIEKYSSRIASLHLKDRKGPSPNPAGGAPIGGANMPWGQGGTPLKEVLQLMKAKKYSFPASIEYEYQTPEGSDVLAEMKKCVQYCKAALA